MSQLLTRLSAMKWLIIFFGLQVSFASCSKECPEPKHPITGIWIGTYTADLLPHDPPQYFSFIIKPEGRLTVESHPNGNVIYADGTWTLSGNKLSCEYVYPNALQGYAVTQQATADFDSENGKLTNGVWQNIGAPEGTGKFTMERVDE